MNTGYRQEEGSRWFAVHTKPRQEHIAEENLARQGYECFLPRAFNPQRKLKSQNPKVEALFPRYLFVNVVFGQQTIATVNYTRGVHRIVKFGATLANVPEWIVTRLKQATDTVSGLVRLDPMSLKKGDKVEVFDGPLAGIRGIIQSLDGEQRALLLMQILGREQRVHVNADCLRAAR